MPLVLITVGVIFLVTAVNGTSSAFLSLLKSDFIGQDNFTYWLISIVIVGALGYVDELEPFADGFLALIVIMLLLSNKGFFTQFNTGISATQQTQAA